MTDLVEFLRARLDEDRLLALTAKCDGQTGRDQWNFVDSGDDLIGGVVRDGTDDRVADDLYRVHALHIARHDPARVLREVEAQRRRVTLAMALIEQETDSPAATLMKRQVGEEMLRLEAFPYAEHPDYQQEWKP